MRARVRASDARARAREREREFRKSVRESKPCIACLRERLRECDSERDKE